jgi:hypothetical protein
MKAARILVLSVALAAGGAAAYIIGAGEHRQPQAPLAKSTISALSFAIRSLFGANTISDGVTERRTVSAPPASVFAATIAS